MAGYGAYPVELAGEYQERVSRVLWLIKWILIIPHYVVLGLLSIPTILTVPLSWLIIIIMGRYPEFYGATTPACCGGVGASTSTPMKRATPTGTRPFPSRREATTRLT